MTNHTPPSSFPTDQIFTTTALPGISLRVMLDTEGQPWFVARDVALALGYEKPGNVIQQHCKKVNKITQVPVSGGSAKTPPIQLLLIPESDVYRLIMRSKLKAAVRFQDWVVEEVLPSLRRAGRYSLISADHTDLGLPDFRNPVDAANAWAAGYANL
ncbi:MAG: BRO family protein [Desulfovibrio sp.]|uniref:BRO-N domain-containing protein n=1 Tax=Desulfovibrio TaxID=872 RepID=UPI0026F07219|nr:MULTISPECIES: BRO family protein [Desulfovibrio]MDY6234842.1 BRO family protein [Desulfovibrio sp.]